MIKYEVEWHSSPVPSLRLRLIETPVDSVVPTITGVYECTREKIVDWSILSVGMQKCLRSTPLLGGSAGGGVGCEVGENAAPWRKALSESVEEGGLEKFNT